MGKNLDKLTGIKESRSNTALLILDMVSDFEFEDGDRLFRNAIRMAEPLARLQERAREAEVTVIYVNDNFGKWQQDFATFVRSVEESSDKGRQIMELLAPKPNDYHVLKPQRSAFYGTPLDVLLLTLDVSELVITGVTTDICVLFSAHDAYMRGYKLKTPKDCTAAVEEQHHSEALALMERVVYADIGPGENLHF